MTPVLALRGRLIAAAAALFVAAGMIHRDAWPLVALGFAVAAALASAYVWFYPTAIYLRRHKVELAWWVPPGDQPGGALTAGVPFALHVALRNRGERALRVLATRIHASSAIQVPAELAVRVEPGWEVEVSAQLRADAVGHWTLHGALILIGDALGLFEVRAYFPSPIRLKVFPKMAAPRAEQALLRPQVGALHERVGVHTMPRRGLMGDLREIRDHAHGDPFKFIAWKATARRRRLMVRELESEIVVTHQLLVDMAATLRGGAPGQARLDWSIETATALARAALEGGDRVGLCTFDTRLYGQLKPGEGRPHFLKVLDRLIEMKTVVDADLTELTDGELVAAVARYLVHQEGVDLRLARPPAANDPAWARVAAGPAGELYDLGALGDLVANLLRARPRPGPAGAASTTTASLLAVPSAPSAGAMRAVARPELERLRAFCRARGIELPYRQSVDPGARAEGLAEALERAAAGERSQLVVLISDLEGVLDDPAAVRRGIHLLRRRHHHLVAIVPPLPDLLSARRTAAGAEVARILAGDDQRRLDAARRELARLGVPAALAEPNESPDAVVRRLLRARGAARRRG
jgi:uncharacterized protein (DUF58 family)